MSAFDVLGIDHNLAVCQDDYSSNQEQTKNTFAYKWQKRNTYESDAMQDVIRQWLFDNYCDGNPEKLYEWLAGEQKVILDAGCGAGVSGLLFFNEHLKKHHYLGVDISDAVYVAKQRFEEAGQPGDFLKASITDMPMIPEESVDMIFSEGVLHHTDSVEYSLNYLAGKLKKGGRFLFYVYKKKAPIREFCDDHIREAIAGCSDEEAWEMLMPLTKFGQALGELQVEVDVPEDIPLLGVKKGLIDIQRFFYWYVFKAYYRPQFSLDEMNHINFDWYRPLNCIRHTPAEIEQYCRDANLSIDQINVVEAGITVVATKTS